MKRYILGNFKTCHRRFIVLASNRTEIDEFADLLSDDPNIEHLSDGSTVCKTKDAAFRYLDALSDLYHEDGVDQ